MEGGVQGFDDHQGRPSTGGWNSAFFIIGVEMAERFAYSGISSNLITYMTGPMGESTAVAAANVNAWDGVASMLPLVGGFLADTYVGRYRMIVLASSLYLLGLSLLTLSAWLPSLRPPDCTPAKRAASSCPPPSTLQTTLFFSFLYLVAIAQSGHKPCVQAFGADQFDSRDPAENKAKSSFFNWWYFGICSSILASLVILSYIQDNVSWVLGFGVPAICMAVALVVFFIGTKTYRHHVVDDTYSAKKIAEAFRKRFRSAKGSNSEPLLQHPNNQSFKSLDDKMVVIAVDDQISNSTLGEQQDYKTGSVEEANGLLPLVPIWSTCFIYAIIFAQPQTLFTKQGSTLDRHIGGGSLQFPPAALQSFISIAIVVFIPFYDRIVLPVFRKCTGNPSGITMLQRIGAGMLMALICMVVAALVEMKRLKTARGYGLVDIPTAVVPMSLWWLIPQYIIFGVSQSLTMVGLQEFFYDQMPGGLRSLGLGLYLSIFGIGDFLSSFMISVIDWLSARKGESWFSNNLNRAHLDYFYWLLAGLTAAALVIYLYFARSYVYKNTH